MPPVSVLGDMVLQNAPHCHGAIHPSGPATVTIPHPPVPLPLVTSSETVMACGRGVVRVGDETEQCMLPTCVPGGPGVVAKGSTTVMVNNMPAARVNDPTMHGSCIAPIPSPTGKITGPGVPTVIIGG